MKSYSSSIAGFGLLQVMIGTVVLGIFAMIFVRKAYNRNDINKVTELITYRDQVIDYYAAVVQSRTAWQCIRQCNGGLPTTTASAGLIIYDGDGNCQSGCPTSPSPTIRLPSQGWRFASDDNDFVFEPPSWTSAPSGTGSTADTHPFHVKAEWQKASSSSSSNSVKVTVSIFFDPHEDWKKEHTALDIGDRHRVFYMNRSPYKNCADGLAARFGSNTFFDDGGTGTGVERYAGDTAVVAIDSTTGLVECWDSPLVIPPCYRPNQPPFNRTQPSSDFDSVSNLDFVAATTCNQGSGDQGLCPKTTGSGTTGITHFDRRTGISHCGKDHILMVESGGVSGINCGTNGNGGLVGISSDGQFICSNDSGRSGTGVRRVPSPCPYGIQGWDSSGSVVCANNSSVGRWVWERWRWKWVSEREKDKDHGFNKAINDGYWVGDKGETGCQGNSIRSCNCCEFPMYCTDTPWRNLRMSWRCRGNRKTCEYISDSRLKYDFKGCVIRNCNNHGCPSLSRCNRNCGRYSSSGWGCLKRRYNDARPIRDYNNACSACRSRNNCYSKYRSYVSCYNSCPLVDNNRRCNGSCDDEYDTWNECDDDCLCGSPPTPTLTDCRSVCNQGRYPNDYNNCSNKSFRDSWPHYGWTTLGVACARCNDYKTRCEQAESDAKAFKRGASITPEPNEAGNCNSSESRIVPC